MRLLLPFLIVPLLAGGSAWARPVEGLTHCETVVTGQGEAERDRGLGLCLAEVLVRVAGRPDLAADPRLPALQARAPALATALEYEDRMKGLPIGDEQGTRDRPFFLRATFDTAGVNAMLASLGHSPWPADRPVLGVVVTSRQGDRQWQVTRQDPGATRAAQVEALEAAARRFGLPLALPEREGPEGEDAAVTADAILTGDLVFDEAGLGWRAVWSMPGRPVPPWTIAGVSFDDAFRAGIAGAASILSASILSGGPQP